MFFWTLPCFVVQYPSLSPCVYLCNVGSFHESSFCLTCLVMASISRSLFMTVESFANLRLTSPEALCSKGTWIQAQHCWTQSWLQHLPWHKTVQLLYSCQWWANKLGVLLFIISPSTFCNSPFRHSEKLSLLLPPPLLYFFFSSTSYDNRNNYLSIQFACSSSARLLIFLHPRHLTVTLQQGSLPANSKALSKEKTRRITSQTANSLTQCRPFLLQAVSAKKV